MLRARSSYYLKPCPLSEMHPWRMPRANASALKITVPRHKLEFIGVLFSSHAGVP